MREGEGEGEGVVAGQASSLGGALPASRTAGHAHLNLDGTLIPTERVSTPGPTDARTRKKTGPERTEVDGTGSSQFRVQGSSRGRGGLV